jgi:hypothetical protein
MRRVARGACACLVVGLVVGLAAPAAADCRPSDPDDPCSPAPVQRQWYGWQLLFPDVLTIIGMATVPVWGPDVGWWVVADAHLFIGIAPSIHAAHRREWAAVGSGALRALLPAALGVAGFLAAGPDTQAPPCTSTFCDLGPSGWGLYAGVLAGMGLASAIDVALLAWEKAPTVVVQGQEGWHVSAYAARAGGGLAVSFGY